MSKSVTIVGCPFCAAKESAPCPQLSSSSTLILGLGYFASRQMVVRAKRVMPAFDERWRSTFGARERRARGLAHSVSRLCTCGALHSAAWNLSVSFMGPQADSTYLPTYLRGFNFSSSSLIYRTRNVPSFQSCTLSSHTYLASDGLPLLRK